MEATLNSLKIGLSSGALLSGNPQHTHARQVVYPPGMRGISGPTSHAKFALRGDGGVAYIRKSKKEEKKTFGFLQEQGKKLCMQIPCNP